MISGDMLKSIDEVLFTYATMSLADRDIEHGTLAKLAITKFANEATKQRLKDWAGLKPNPKERLATEVSLSIINTSKSGHSRMNGANGPGVVAEDPHKVELCPPV